MAACTHISACARTTLPRTYTVTRFLRNAASPEGCADVACSGFCGSPAQRLLPAAWVWNMRRQLPAPRGGCATARCGICGCAARRLPSFTRPPGGAARRATSALDTHLYAAGAKPPFSSSTKQQTFSMPFPVHYRVASSMLYAPLLCSSTHAGRAV